MITLSDVSWTYPHADSPTLRDIDLHVAAGEFVVLCGASGSGKSTALRMMNGLIPHFYDDGVLTGSVSVCGIDTLNAHVDDVGLHTGTVLQHPRRQFFTDSVRDEVAFAMENFGFNVEEIRARVNQTVASLAQVLPVGQPLHYLSGGQQQQVAIAAATAHSPRAVLLDEPSSNLSYDAVTRLTATLARLKAAGVTIVIAEHRLRYLQDLIDRVVVMRDGGIDVVWTADQFRCVSDEELQREGLRGRVRSVELPALPAVGQSVVTSAAAAEVPAPEALELEGIRCRLGGRIVLDLERVAFPAGAVTAIRGANGSGKTTLARIVTGLQRSAGTVRLGTKTLSLSARQRMSALVMQDVQRQLFSETVAGEIELAATGTDPKPDTHAILSALDLDNLATRHPLSLSGGQQQRLVIAAARVSGRRIVVFDEPSSGVDRRHLQSISEHIRALAAGGAVVLLISHDEDLIAQAADHQITLGYVDQEPVAQ